MSLTNVYTHHHHQSRFSRHLISPLKPLCSQFPAVTDLVSIPKHVSFPEGHINGFMQ